MIQIESRQNAALKHLIRLGREKKYRQAQKEMLCEGEKMLQEALSSGVQVKTVLARIPQSEMTQDLLQQAQAQGAKCYAAEEPIYTLASGVETPQGVIFSCVPPQPPKDFLQTVNRVLILDGLQDPGNLGTILRTADAFAVDAVILAEGCTDATAPKVVRATMGAIFRLPIVQMSLKESIAVLRQHSMPIYAAALTEDAVAVGNISLQRSAVIIGSEGHGVSQTALEQADAHIILPMKGRAESLNAGVAAAILMWEMTK